MKLFSMLRLVVATALPLVSANAQWVAFNFDGGPAHASLPLSQTSDGLTADFAATGFGFSIQPANTLGFTPVDFSGNCLYPNSVFAADLLISFSSPLDEISIEYAPEEYDTDSSCTMQIRAYAGTTLVGSNTATIDPPGTWPTGLLSFASTESFDNVVIHYLSAPPTGGDYGPVFLADNLMVHAVPEAADAATIIIGLVSLAVLWRARRRPSV